MKTQPPALRIWKKPWTGSDGNPPRSAANHESRVRTERRARELQFKWDSEREMLLTRADLSAFEENETTSDFLMLDFKCREMWREISILLKQLHILMENYMQYIYVCVAELFALQRYRINNFKSKCNWMLQAITSFLQLFILKITLKCSLEVHQRLRGGKLLTFSFMHDSVLIF